MTDAPFIAQIVAYIAIYGKIDSDFFSRFQINISE